MAKGKKSKAEVKTAKVEAEESQKDERTCACGVVITAQGAVLCRVCKAIADRDKKKAKARAKAKAKKGKKVDPATSLLAQRLYDETMLQIREVFMGNPDGEIATVKHLAHKLNSSLKTEDVEVKPSFEISGTDVPEGWKYNIKSI